MGGGGGGGGILLRRPESPEGFSETHRYWLPANVFGSLELGLQQSLLQPQTSCLSSQKGGGWGSPLPLKGHEVGLWARVLYNHVHRGWA